MRTPFASFAAVLLFASAGSAANAATCTLPETISNGQVADAAKIMDNFDAVADCAEDAVTTTGTITTGSIAVFSGANTIASGDLSGDVTTSGSAATTLSNSGVTAGAYSNANIVVDAKGRITSAADGSSGSGGGWTVLNSTTISSATASIDVNVTGYDEVMVLYDRVTASASSRRSIIVSTDGGSTYYYGSGAYQFVSNAGVSTAGDYVVAHATNSTGARSGKVVLSGLTITGIPKVMDVSSDSNSSISYFVGSTAPVTNVRLISYPSSNMTGGTVVVLGR